MKTSVLTSLLIFASINAFAMQDYVDGRCVSKISGNKSEFRSLRTSEVVSEFRILGFFDNETTKSGEYGVGRYQLRLPVLRVLPNIRNAAGAIDEMSIRSNQVVLFLDDTASMEEARLQEKNGNVMLRNHGKKQFDRPLFVAFSYNGRDQDKKPYILTDAMSLTGGIDKDSLQFRNKTATFEIETDITFEFQDFNYRGVLGIPGFFSSDSDNERLVQDGMDTHKAKLKMECTLKLSEKVKEEEQRAEVEDDEKSDEEKAREESARLEGAFSGLEVEINEDARPVIRE